MARASELTELCNSSSTHSHGTPGPPGPAGTFVGFVVRCVRRAGFVGHLWPVYCADRRKLPPLSNSPNSRDFRLASVALRRACVFGSSGRTPRAPCTLGLETKEQVLSHVAGLTKTKFRISGATCYKNSTALNMPRHDSFLVTGRLSSD